MTKTARIIGSATTPKGEQGILIECICRTHAPGETKAIVLDHPAIRNILDRESIHGYVFASRNSLVTKANNGPWKA